MSKLECYTCDGCGKQGEGQWHNMAVPYGWYSVSKLSKYYSFCTKACLEQWVLGKAIVPEVEPSKVLFMKWLKSLVR